MKLSFQAKGLLITTAGVLAISPDTLLVRLLELDKWSLLFYRGCIMAICLTLFTLFQHRHDTLRQFKAIGLPGIWIIFSFSCSTTCFVTSLYYTSVANTLVILSGSSMFAALYSRIFLKETIALRTLITMMMVISAIAYIVWDDLGSWTLRGDLLAVCAAMFMAGTFTIMRRSRAQNMIPATAMSGVLTACVTFFPADFAPLTSTQIILLGCLGLLLATAFGLLTLGPRYISSPEVSLLMQIETVLGPLLIWLVIGEKPPNSALYGGVVVIGALTVHSVLSLRSRAHPMK